MRANAVNTCWIEMPRMARRFVETAPNPAHAPRVMQCERTHDLQSACGGQEKRANISEAPRDAVGWSLGKNHSLLCRKPGNASKTTMLPSCALL